MLCLGLSACVLIENVQHLRDGLRILVAGVRRITEAAVVAYDGFMRDAGWDRDGVDRIYETALW